MDTYTMTVAPEPAFEGMVGWTFDVRKDVATLVDLPSGLPPGLEVEITLQPGDLASYFAKT